MANTRWGVTIDWITQDNVTENSKLHGENSKYLERTLKTNLKRILK